MKRGFGTAGGILLIAFVGFFIWPTPHRYWTVQERNVECLIEMNRLTRATRFLCPYRAGASWQNADSSPERTLRFDN